MFIKFNKRNFIQFTIVIFILGVCMGITFMLIAAEFQPYKVQALCGPFIEVDGPFTNATTIFMPREWREYTVQSGDSWWCLAVEVKGENDYDTRNLVIELMDYNHRSNSTLYPGEHIYLPIG